ncbi:hypothetical protein Bca101_025739 [Brassica carinata]
MSTPRGRKRLRRPTYESTFLSGQTDHSASTSGTATQSETVPESQSQERSPDAAAPLPPWVPPAPTKERLLIFAIENVMAVDGVVSTKLR